MDIWRRGILEASMDGIKAIRITTTIKIHSRRRKDK
jgi:hypothetical protein